MPQRTLARPIDLSRRPLTRVEVRTLALASLGGALEFYDFVIFVFFTGVIGSLFFPAGLPDWLRQLQTFGIFAAGYLARPLGGIVMAHFGDTQGRKRMFTLSVLLMAVPTLLIGLLPTYGSIGPAAPLLLLLFRVLQGAAIGGEAPGGWVFVAEHAARERVGLAVGLLTGGLTGGILLGSLMATALTFAASPAAILHGWWRLPFLLGGAFGFAAMVLRRWLEETPVFREMHARAETLPLRTVLERHRGAVLCGILATWMLTATIVVVILMTPTLLQKVFAIPPHVAFPCSLAANAALVLSSVGVGAAIDRFGIRPTAVPVVLLLMLATLGLYVSAGSAPGLLPLFSVLAGLGGGLVTLPAMIMVRGFPPPVRFTGLSFSYNLAFALFGGITPLLVAWLVHLDRLAPVSYVAVISAIGLAATLAAPQADEDEEGEG